MENTNEILLRIEIKNKTPIELLDLTKSFVSLANQFNSYVASNGESKEDREAKLYVREIKTGSVILDLVELATKSILPFVENVNTIVGFAGYIKDAYNFLIGKSKEQPTYFTHNDYRDLSQILNPVANDNASQINVSTVVNNTTNVYLTINSLEANAIQNIIEKRDKELKESAPSNDIKTNVLLTLFQTKADPKAKTGNKGIVEDISPKSFPLIFDNEELNRRILHQEFNPYEKIFVVDIQPQHVSNKIAAYKIINLHEVLDKD